MGSENTQRATAQRGCCGVLVFLTALLLAHGTQAWGATNCEARPSGTGHARPWENPRAHA